MYERDPSAAHRPQGSRVSLRRTGVQALRACLPAHLFDAVHSMGPGRGEGAAYEHAMLGYAFAAVAASRDHPFAPSAARPGKL
ncbi:hypothetical protein [Nonomuraea sp. NPDC050783]|uniref:hypothetical protein n=1 Tax=Nonomuraea sp. NPDC050783 TaxID=3154634 RepID=UPI0034664FC9